MSYRSERVIIATSSALGCLWTLGLCWATVRVFGATWDQALLIGVIVEISSLRNDAALREQKREGRLRYGR